jgi:hypothetical protein
MRMDIRKYIMVIISSNVPQDYFSIFYNYKAKRACMIPTFWLSSQLLLDVSLNVSNVHSMVIINSNFNLNDQKFLKDTQPHIDPFFWMSSSVYSLDVFSIDMNLIVKNARSIIIINSNTLRSNINKQINNSIRIAIALSLPSILSYKYAHT